MNVSGGLIISATLLILGSGVYWIRREMNDLAKDVAPIVAWWSELEAEAVAELEAGEPPTDEFPAVEPDTVIAHPAATQVRQQELLRPVPYAREGGRHRA